LNFYNFSRPFPASSVSSFFYSAHLQLISIFTQHRRVQRGIHDPPQRIMYLLDCGWDRGLLGRFTGFAPSSPAFSSFFLQSLDPRRVCVVLHSGLSSSSTCTEDPSERQVPTNVAHYGLVRLSAICKSASPFARIMTFWESPCCCDRAFMSRMR
jgi:hypothetical protein